MKKEGSRKYNKFGRGEHSNFGIKNGDSDDDEVDLNLMCVILDQGSVSNSPYHSWDELSSEDKQ